MQQQLDFGPRLTDEEYQRRIVQLHGDLPASHSEQRDEEVRRQELELAIDHRLGCDFPRERREALWSVQQRIENRRLRLALKYLLRRILPRYLAHGAQSLATYAADEYATVLSVPELRRFLDLQEGERPVLPVDMDQLRK